MMASFLEMPLRGSRNRGEHGIGQGSDDRIPAKGEREYFRSLAGKGFKIRDEGIFILPRSPGRFEADHLRIDAVYPIQSDLRFPPTASRKRRFQRRGIALKGK